MKPRDEWGPADVLADMLLNILFWAGLTFSAAIVFVFLMWLYSLVLG